MACGEIQQTLTEGTDYVLDLAIGRIKFLSTGALGPVIQQFYDGGGCAVRIDYDCPGAPHILCPSKIDTCLPCNDDPVLNISAEDSDVDRFLFNFNTRQRPRLGFSFQNVGCKRWCFSEVSQEEADLCAILQVTECINDGWRDDTAVGPVPPFQVPQPPALFFNFAQHCVTSCPDGSTFGAVIPAGRVADRNQDQANRIAFSLACRLSAQQRVCIRTTSLPTACLDAFYSKQLLGSGGTPFRVTFDNFAALSALCAPATSFPNSVFPYVWSATGLPPGLSVEPCSGLITGTPTTSGSFAVTVRAQDSIGSFQTKNLTLKVLEFTTAATLPEATVDIPYSQTIAVSPGGSYTFAFSSESVPAWMQINSATGQIFGTPDVVQDSIVFTVIVTDAAGGQCEKSFSLNVDEQSTLLDDLLFSTPLDSYNGALLHYPVAFTAFAGGQLSSGNSTVVAKIINGFNSGPTGAIDSDASTLGFPGGKFTYAFWLKINAISVTGDILDRPGTNKGYIFRLTPAGALTFFHGNGAGFDSVVAGIALGTGVWYHIVATYEDGVAMTIRVSTEGAFNAKATSVPTAFARADDFTATTLRINSPGTMDIIYDEIDCWTRVLSDAEAQEHWNNGNGIAYPF